MKIVHEIEDGWDFANLVRDYVDVKSGYYIPYNALVEMYGTVFEYEGEFTIDGIVDYLRFDIRCYCGDHAKNRDDVLNISDFICDYEDELHEADINFEAFKNDKEYREDNAYKLDAVLYVSEDGDILVHN